MLKPGTFFLQILRTFKKLTGMLLSKFPVIFKIFFPFKLGRRCENRQIFSRRQTLYAPVGPARDSLMK